MIKDFNTLKILDDNGICHAGAGKNILDARKPAVMEIKGLKVGLLSYTNMADIEYKVESSIRFEAEKDRYGVAPSSYDYIIEMLSFAESLGQNAKYKIEPNKYFTLGNLGSITLR